MINKGSSLDRALHHDDMNAARELLEEIERRGLQDEYLCSLLEWPTYSAGDDVPWRVLWPLIRATPKQHAQAFAACIQE